MSGSMQRGPEEKSLRRLLADGDVREAADLIDAGEIYREILGRLAKEKTEVGAAADAVLGFLKTRKKLRDYIVNGNPDNVVSDEEFIVKLGEISPLGSKLRAELNYDARARASSIRNRAAELLDVLSIPKRVERMQQRLSIADATGSVAYVGKLAAEDQKGLDLEAIERVVARGGETGRRAQAALFYNTATEFLRGEFAECSGSFREMESFIVNLPCRSDSPEALALHVAFEVMADRNETREERLAAHLLGIVRDPLRHKFFDLLATSSSEDVADWLEGLGAVEFDRLAAEYQSGERRCESELMRTALGVFATMRHRRGEIAKAEAPAPEVTQEPPKAEVKAEVAAASIENILLNLY